MKALSLWQPWATLMAIGAKTIETRPRRMNYRGPLLICATKTWQPDILRRLRFARWTGNSPQDAWDRIAAALCKAGFKSAGGLLLGAALCSVDVCDCVPTEDIRKTLWPEELAFGDFRDGRFAILTNRLWRFSVPFPITGRQGLFEIEVPHA